MKLDNPRLGPNSTDLRKHKLDKPKPKTETRQDLGITKLDSPNKTNSTKILKKIKTRQL